MVITGVAEVGRGRATVAITCIVAALTGVTGGRGVQKHEALER